LDNYTVIGGTASEALAKKLANKLKGRYIKSHVRIFPDQEIKIMIQNKPKKGKIIVVQSTSPPVHSNLIQALSLITKARQFSSQVYAVVPYMGYARQDREFLLGEVVTMTVIASMFQAAGAIKIIVVDIHSKKALDQFKIPSENVSAIPGLVRYFKKMRLNKPLIVSPDIGGADRAQEFSRLFKSNYIVLNKKRDRKTGKVQMIFSNIKEVQGHAKISL